MHRTQIYFEEDFFELLKERARGMGVSVSAYIREVLKKDLQQQMDKRGRKDFSEFAGMWRDREIDLEDIRERAWKR